jgi:hypothetical protein
VGMMVLMASVMIPIMTVVMIAGFVFGVMISMILLFG